MAAVAEVAAEAAETLLPEMETIGTKLVTSAKGVGSKLMQKLHGKGASKRLMDVGTGVMIGQALHSSESGQRVAQAATQSIAAIQAPPGQLFVGGADEYGCCILILLVMFVVVGVGCWVSWIKNQRHNFLRYAYNGL